MTSKDTKKGHVEIHYCTQCKWLLRAAWMAQELLGTFEEEIGTLALKPGTGGVFEVSANGKQLWNRKEKGRFPEITELKRLIRDEVAPGRHLGHVDRKEENSN
ncbi:SelT/SelW/SelH family protein [Pleomorphovibrio marinus]|uniref:SelT/SelW/SelH family protein n=1 Tax=Pleomorphovibrio marinus TaxID=2164132 RepID=UPI000E0C46B4|nr:SelT/SelW/SelH family protein [Pleomorphovibrio marinus]